MLSDKIALLVLTGLNKGAANGEIKITIIEIAIRIEIKAAIRTENRTEIENLRKIRSSIALLAVLLLVASCDSGSMVSDSIAISGTWHKNETIAFEIPQLDSLKKYNVFLQIRNSNEYKFNNLFLIVSMNFPHGKTIVDTLEYRMANPDGSWLGQGIGSIKENKFWYKENISFFEDGTYTLTIAHAVRNNGDVEGVTNLEGITDVGFSIEEAFEQ